MMTTPFSALLRLNLEQQLRSRRWFVALLLFGVIFAAGAAWADDQYSTFGDGLVVAVIVALNFGIANDRKHGFDRLISNFVTPRHALSAKVAVTFALYLGIYTIAFIAAALVWGEPRLALWYVTYMFLVLGLILPLSLLIEMLITIEIPAVLAMLMAMLLMTYWLLSAGEDQLTHRIAFMGLDTEPAHFRSLGRLFQVGMIWNSFVIVMAAGIWIIQSRQKAIRPLS
ncbi:MAG: hypothetical protein ACT4O1_06690 [Gemmatimonadota bacterium]